MLADHVGHQHASASDALEAKRQQLPCVRGGRESLGGSELTHESSVSPVFENASARITFRTPSVSP